MGCAAMDPNGMEEPQGTDFGKEHVIIVVIWAVALLGLMCWAFNLVKF